MKRHTLADLPVVENGLYLVAEAVEKPGNLGSILRSADAAGVDGLIICNKCTDLYNPNVIRASTGALFSVPLAEAENPGGVRLAEIARDQDARGDASHREPLHRRRYDPGGRDCGRH